MNVTKHDRLRRAAFHEAGHVVATIAVKRPFRGVSIVPDDDSLGRILNRAWQNFRPGREADARTIQRLEGTVLALLSGLAAEYKLTGRHHWRGACFDIKQAVNLASYLYQANNVLGAYMKFMIERAKEFVADPRTWKELRL